ncbi:carbohydrate kinase family protein, partial [bacterium]|nr:carbohydrate kinase family protein [bacterium]
LSKMMECADFFIASETILDMDKSLSRIENLHQLQKQIQGEFIITWGAQGSFWIQKDKITHVQSLKDIKVKDTTGAGDVYHATFAYYYPQSKSVTKSMKLASIAGALSTQFLGTRDRTMFEQGLESLLDQVDTREMSFKDFEEWIGSN